MISSTTHDHRAKEAQHTMTAEQMAKRETPQTPSNNAQVASMKRAATRLKKATPGLTHAEALNRIATERGYQGWWGAVKKLMRGQK